jgi:hypothetical protein
MITLIRWHADNSELRGIKEAEIPDVLLFGGISASHDTEQKLRVTIDEVKARYGTPRAVIKWNFLDLRKLYEDQGKQADFRVLLESSSRWRRDIFEAIRESDFTIVMSVLESHSRHVV